MISLSEAAASCHPQEMKLQPCRVGRSHDAGSPKRPARPHGPDRIDIRQPMTPEMRKALERAQKRFGHIPGAQISVSASPATEGKPVVLVRHAQADPNNLTLQTHFHGYMHMDAQVKYEKRIGETVAAAWARDPNLVFVLPEARNEGQDHSDWNNAKNVTAAAQNALEGSGLTWQGVKTCILSGHSAGGSPVAKALARAQMGEEGVFHRVELYDPAFRSNPTVITEKEQARCEAYVKAHQSDMLLVPGTMNSHWLRIVEKSRYTERAKDHFAALWESLGQLRSPKDRA